MSSESQLWYALHVKTKFERVAATILQGKNLQVYLPTYRKRQTWSDRIKHVECPLFPGYVFCRFDVNHRLPVLTTTGVLSVVGAGRAPAPIADEEMTAVRMIVESGVAAMPWPFLRVGQRVIIRKGPLWGWKAYCWRTATSIESWFRSAFCSDPSRRRLTRIWCARRSPVFRGSPTRSRLSDLRSLFFRAELSLNRSFDSPAVRKNKVVAA